MRGRGVCHCACLCGLKEGKCVCVYMQSTCVHVCLRTLFGVRMNQRAASVSPPPQCRSASSMKWNRRYIGVKKNTKRCSLKVLRRTRNYLWKSRQKQVKKFSFVWPGQYHTPSKTMFRKNSINCCRKTYLAGTDIRMGIADSNGGKRWVDQMMW